MNNLVIIVVVSCLQIGTAAVNGPIQSEYQASRRDSSITKEHTGDEHNAPDAKPISFTQTQVNEIVKQKLAQGIKSGQIYTDGTEGTYTIRNLGADSSGKACFVWEVTGYNKNNTPNILTIISDGKKKK